MGPLLSAVKLNINSIHIENRDEKEIIEKACKHLDSIITAIRQISYDLLPNTLDRKGLPGALKEFVSQVTAKKNLIIKVQSDENFFLEKSKWIHVFRMLQEIIHNVVKHAQATHLEIILSSENTSICVYAKDNGVGFELNKAKNDSTGFGLKSIESRAELLGGKLSIATSPGEGTVYFIQIPS